MTHSFISDLRKQQSALAKPIARTLFQEVKPYIANGKYDALKAYVTGAEELCGVEELCFSSEGDKDYLELIIKSEIVMDVVGAVRKYTDWIASRIVRQGDYSLPSPAEIDYDAIGNNDLVKRVIGYMHSQPELPLLGKIEDGHFRPDPLVFDAWKSFYDLV